MANEPTDFLRLYQELGLVPGASLDDLRRAYRRRVSELHPDRVGQNFTASMPGAAERLQRITVLYSKATQFHRQYGRLPGSSPAPFATAQESNDESYEPKVQRRPPYLLWIFLAAAAVALIVWMSPGDAPESEDDAASTDTATASAPISRVQPMPPVPVRRAPRPWQVLKIGMTDDKVLAVQGAPVSRDELRWDYGPSWISFENGKVVGWYSSPLRPLKYATPRPPPLETIDP